MAVRVLGYKTVAEKQGTWPVNYINKAQQLKLLDDIKYGTYAEGAIRGNVALLIWNILRAPMWDVTDESEKNGLVLSDKNKVTLIDKAFDKYEYTSEDDEVYVTDIKVEDGKVMIDVSDKDGKDIYSEVELAKDVEFLEVLGRKVSMLYNKKDKEVVMLTPSVDDNVKADYKSVLVDDKYVFGKEEESITWGETASKDNYVVAVIGSKKNVDYKTEFKSAESYVVKETKMSSDTLRVTTEEGKVLRITNEDALVLIDGKWSTREDLKAGDVITVLSNDQLYVVSRNTVTGKFKDVNTTDNTITVDNDEYKHILTDRLYEIDSNDKKTSVLFSKLNKDSKYFDEDAKLFLNFLGEVVRVEFEEVKDVDDGNFYVLTNEPTVWEESNKSGVTKYIELNNETYEIKTTADEMKDFNYKALKSGKVVFAKFDNKDRIVELKAVGTEGKVDEYDFVTLTDKLNDNYIGEYKVSSSTKVYTITEVKDDDKDIVGYEVEITTGQDALKGIDKAKLLAHKDGSTIVSYAFVWETAKNTNVEYGIIAEDGVKSGVQESKVTIDETTYVIDEDETTKLTKADEGKVIAFIDNGDSITIEALYTVEQAKELAAEGRIVLDEIDSNTIYVGSNKTKVDFDTKNFEDIKFVLVEYDPDKDEFTDVKAYTDKDEFTSELDDDYIYDDSMMNDLDAIFVIKGYVYDDTTVDEPTVVTYKVKFEVEGTVIDSGDVEEGKTATAPADPTKADNDTHTYTFAGWTVESGDSQEKVDVTTYKITKDTTFKASFTETAKTVEKFTVKFMNGETPVGNEQKVEKGKTATAPADPTKADDDNYAYTFAGWALTQDGEAVEVDKKEITEDTTFYAVYTKVEKFTVKFMNGETPVGDEQKVKKGDKATAPAEDVIGVPENKTLKGWTIKDADSTLYESDKLPAITADTTFVAVFGE